MNDATDFENVLRRFGAASSPEHPESLDAMMKQTSARIGAGRSGPRPVIGEWLRFRVDHAAARDAIYKPVELEGGFPPEWVCIETQAANREEYLLRPDLGRRVSDKGVKCLLESGLHGCDVLLLIGDGLSAFAIEQNIADVLPSLTLALQVHQLTPSPPIFIQYARVGVMDHIGEMLRPKTVVYLIGERPGLRTAASMSAYTCYQPNLNTVESDRDVISNIHADGLPPVEAGAVIADLIDEYMRHQCSGVKLKQQKRAAV
ncbi:MAG: ethanolamine ammonia-lyase subunit EutC [bacterium]|nr:ethanolamine ammonia-lyase subunit EutC [bacterium]